MKKRTTIIAILLVAALALGIGYANLTSDLTISSKIQYNKADAEEELDADVYFTEATGDNVYCNAYLDQSAGTNNKPDVAHLEIGGDRVSLELATPDHTAEANFTVQNDYDSAVAINPTTVFGGSSMLNTLYDIQIEVTVNSANTNEIPAGGTANVKVTVTPLDVLDASVPLEEFTINLNPSVVVVNNP